jgi:hypothetical protein
LSYDDLGEQPCASNCTPPLDPRRALGFDLQQNAWFRATTY